MYAEARDDRPVIGLIDVGGTKLAAAVAENGVLRELVRRPTPLDDPASALLRLLDSVRSGAPLSAIGVAVPGPFDRGSGALLNPPGLPHSWHGLEIRSALGAAFGCEVAVENDANCAALAESIAGAGTGARTVVYFTVSTGIGTGVVRDRQVVISRHDTEGGHQVVWPEWAGGPRCHCGGAGCLEALASGRAIEGRFGRRGEDLADESAWEDVGRWLGLGAVNAAALLDPDVIVFGGGVCGSWERFAPSLEATLRTHVRLQPAPPVRRGSLPEDRRTLLGALALT